MINNSNGNRNSNGNGNHNSKDSIVNNLIQIIYKKDKGLTLKNAILSKSQCTIYKELDTLTKKNNIITNNHNSNKKKTVKNSSQFNNITQKCFTDKNKLNKQPTIQISDNLYSNDKYSYLVVMISNIVISFNKKNKEITYKNKYLNWIAIINDNKVDKNIIKYSVSKDNGLYNFIIRIYKFQKNDITIINKINTIVNTKKHILIKKLKTVSNLERIYTNNIIMVRETSDKNKWHIPSATVRGLGDLLKAI